MGIIATLLYKKGDPRNKFTSWNIAPFSYYYSNLVVYKLYIIQTVWSDETAATMIITFWNKAILNETINSDAFWLFEAKSEHNFEAIRYLRCTKKTTENDERTQHQLFLYIASPRLYLLLYSVFKCPRFGFYTAIRLSMRLQFTQLDEYPVFSHWGWKASNLRKKLPCYTNAPHIIYSYADNIFSSNVNCMLYQILCMVLVPFA